MKMIQRTIAWVELILICPAALFMMALILRTLQAPQAEPAHTAQQIVMWYSGRLWTLWVLLCVLPLTVLVLGCATLLRGWDSAAGPGRGTRDTLAAIGADRTMLLVAVLTLAAGVILAIVGVHVAMN